MQIEFTYTKSELREATRVGRRHQGRGGFGGLWVPWTLWLCVAVLACVWWVDPPTAFQDRPHERPTLAVRAFAASLPLLFVCFVSGAGVALSGRLTPSGRSLVAVPTTMSLDGDGIASDHAGTSSRITWPNVDRFVETDRLLLLRLTNRRGWLAVPKRAIPDPAQVAELSRTMAEGASQRTAAFPVLPPAAPPA